MFFIFRKLKQFLSAIAITTSKWIDSSFWNHLKNSSHIWYNRCFNREALFPPVLILSCIQFLSYVFVVHNFLFAVSLHTFFGCPIYLLGFHTFFFCGVVTYFFRLLHYTFRLQYVFFCGVVTYFFRLSHYTSRLPYVLFCGVVSYFFRLSHFTFRLPYVLFCGVVIHTFFGCPVLILGFHTFFAVSYHTHVFPLGVPYSLRSHFVPFLTYNRLTPPHIPPDLWLLSGLTIPIPTAAVLSFYQFFISSLY